MKYTDEELQKAIDEAFPAGRREDGFNLDTTALKSYWISEASNRLAIAKAFLEKLQPDPYAELKKAHKEGKAIQYTNDSTWSGEWQDCPIPLWIDGDDQRINARYRIKPEDPKPDPSSTFDAHGKTWTRHTPGDAMPCDGEAMVNYILRRDWPTCATIRELAKNVRWADVKNTPVIGWRYADEPTPPVETPWTPSIGDVVQLKSGGPRMTIVNTADTGRFWCNWFNGPNRDEGCFAPTCLTLVTE